jgi:hypothetical protein
MPHSGGRQGTSASDVYKVAKYTHPYHPTDLPADLCRGMEKGGEGGEGAGGLLIDWLLRSRELPDKRGRDKTYSTVKNPKKIGIRPLNISERQANCWNIKQ